MSRRLQDVDPDTLGGRVRQQRLANGMSLTELADELEVSAMHVSFIERGEGSLSVELMIRLARALDTSCAYLLGEISDPDWTPGPEPGEG